MSTDLPNQDVLFAVYAVQLGFCTPAQVAAAAAAVAADPERALADRLEADGVLGAAQRRAVERRLEREVRDSCETVAAPAAGSLSGTGDAAAGGGECATVDLRAPDAATIAEPPSIDPGPLEEESDEQISLAQTGRYTVQGQHAAGGQARILLAIDEHIGREVAIKELIPGVGSGQWSLDTPDSLQRSTPGAVRFLREARVTGQLEHPSIVPVHEVGRREDGTLYYTMRFVRGDTLARKLKACESLEDRLKLLGAFWDVCQAIAFAHSRGVVHRDIKPDNVMVGEFGETVVLDWGVAKVAGKRDIRANDIERELRYLQQADTGKTAAGTAIGTPSYMSPEQARGQIDSIDERSDVWGLGAVLYEILTGRPPYVGHTPMDTMLQVGEQPLVPVRQVCPDAPAELATVAERCLRKDRTERYRSAQDLVEEINAFMTGGRVRAHDYTSWELFKRFAAKNKVALGAVGLVLAVIIGALIMVTLSLQAETAARQAEHQALERAEAARSQELVERRQAHFHLAQAYAEKADRLLDGMRHPAAATLAAAALVHNPAHPKSPHHDPGFQQRHPRSRSLWVEAASQLYRLQFSFGARLRSMFAAPEALTRLSFSPDGSRLAAGSFDHRVRIWGLDGSADGPLLLEGHDDEVYATVYSPDGRWLATADRKGQVLLRLAGSGAVERRLAGHRQLVHQLDFSPDSRQLASAAWDGTARLWRVADGSNAGVLRHPTKKINGVAFAPDGRQLATAAEDGRVRLWSLPAGELTAQLSEQTEPAYAVAYSADGRLLASAGNDRKIRLWRAADGQALAVLEGHRDGVLSLAFAPDEPLLASASYDKTVRLWDLTGVPGRGQGRPLLTLGSHRNFVFSAAFSPSGHQLATAGWDRSVRLWTIEAGRTLPTFHGHQGSIYALAFTPDGRTLATGAWDHTIRLWDARIEREHVHRARRVLRGHRDIVDNLAVSPDGRWLASASRDRSARIWSLANGRQRHLLRGHRDEVAGVAFSPDSRLLATGGADATIRLWDVASGAQRRVLKGHGDDISSVRFSPDGALLASVSNDKTVRLWDPASGQQLAVLRGHSDWVSGVDFSPDGRWLATSGKDGTAIIWRVADRSQRLRLTGHTQWVNNVVFSPDGRLLATTSDDRTVRVWSTADGRPLLSIATSLEVVAAGFSPDGERLAIGDGALARLYPRDFSLLNADPQQLLQRAEKNAGVRLEGFDLRVLDASSR